MELFVIIIIGIVIYFIVFKKRKRSQFIETESFSGSGNYQLDLNTLSCSCPDFQKRRTQFSMEDPRRLCKHLIEEIDPFDYFSGDSAYHILAIDSNYGFPTGERIIISVGNKTITAYINDDKNKVWIDVFDSENRYGFNVKEQRWSYGTGPDRSKDIAKCLTEQWSKIYG
jgi:hypothetical protein